MSICKWNSGYIEFRAVQLVRLGVVPVVPSRDLLGFELMMTLANGRICLGTPMVFPPCPKDTLEEALHSFGKRVGFEILGRLEKYPLLVCNSLRLQRYH